MQELSSTGKYRQNQEINVQLEPRSLKRRRIDRTTNGKTQCNFNDYEYERNTGGKPFNVNKVSSTSRRNRLKTYETVSKEVQFGRQDNNCVHFVKTGVTQQNTTPRNKMTISNLQGSRKSKSNLAPLLNQNVSQKQDFENIGKEYNKISEINAFHLQRVNKQTCTDTLTMNKRVEPKEILQQPSSSKNQSEKLYQNNKASDKTFARSYMDRAHNSSDLRDKACNKSVITYKQISNEAREMHRHEIANNILCPKGKGCVSHSPRDLFVSSHNFYASESKDSEHQKLVSKMDKITPGTSQSFLDRCKTDALRKRKNATSGRHILCKCKCKTEFINWIMDKNKQNLTLKKNDSNKQFSELDVTRKPDTIVMYETNSDSSATSCTCTMADIMNYVKLKSGNDLVEAEKVFKSNFQVEYTNIFHRIKLKICDDLIKAKETIENNDNSTETIRSSSPNRKKMTQKDKKIQQTPQNQDVSKQMKNKKKTHKTKEQQTVEKYVQVPRTGITISSKTPNIGSLVKLEKYRRDEKVSTSSSDTENHEKGQNVKPFARDSRKTKNKKNNAKEQRGKSLVKLDTRDKASTAILENLEKGENVKTFVKDRRGNKRKKKVAKGKFNKSVTLDTGEKDINTNMEHLENEQYDEPVVKDFRGSKSKKKKAKKLFRKSVPLDKGKKGSTTDMETFEKGQYVKSVGKDSRGKKTKNKNAKVQLSKSVTADTRKKDRSTNMENSETDQYDEPVVKDIRGKKRKKRRLKCLFRKSVKANKEKNGTTTDMKNLENGQYVKRFAKYSRGNKTKKRNVQDQLRNSVTLDAGKKYPTTYTENLENEQYDDEQYEYEPVVKDSRGSRHKKTNAKVQHRKSKLKLNTENKDTITDMEHLEKEPYVKSVVKGSAVRKNKKNTRKIQHNKSVTLDTGEKDITTDMEKIERGVYVKPVAKDSGDNKNKKKRSKSLLRKSRTRNKEKNDATAVKVKKNRFGKKNKAIKDQSSPCQCKIPLEEIMKLLEEYYGIRNISERNEKYTTVSETDIYNNGRRKRKDHFILFQDNMLHSNKLVKSVDRHELEIESRSNLNGGTQAKYLRINDSAGDSSRDVNNNSVNSLLCKLLNFPLDTENSNVEVKCLDKVSNPFSKFKKTKSEETTTSLNKYNCSLLHSENAAIAKKLRDEIVGSTDDFYNRGDRSTSTGLPGVGKCAQYKIQTYYDISAPGYHSMKTVKGQRTPAQNVTKVRITKCLYIIPVIIKRVLPYVAMVLSSPCIFIVLGLYFCLGRKQARPINIKLRSRLRRSLQGKTIFKPLTANSLSGNTHNSGRPMWVLKSKRQHRPKKGRNVGGDLIKKGLINSYMSIMYTSIPQRINLDSTLFKRTDAVKHKRDIRKSYIFKEHSQRNKNTRYSLAGGDAPTTFRKKLTFFDHVDPEIKTYNMHNLLGKEKAKKKLALSDTKTQTIYPINVYRCDKSVRSDTLNIVPFDEDKHWNAPPEECRSTNEANKKDENKQTHITTYINKYTLENDKSGSVFCKRQYRCSKHKKDANLQIPNQCSTQRSSYQRCFFPLNKQDSSMQTPIIYYTNELNSNEDSFKNGCYKNQSFIWEKNNKNKNLQIQPCTHNSIGFHRCFPLNKNDGNMHTLVASNKYSLENDGFDSVPYKNQCSVNKQNKKDENWYVPSQSYFSNTKRNRNMQIRFARYPNHNFKRNCYANVTNKTQCAIYPKIKNNDKLQSSRQFWTDVSSGRDRFCLVNKQDGNKQTQITYKGGNSENVLCKTPYDIYTKNKEDRNLQSLCSCDSHNSSCQCCVGPVYKKDRYMHTKNPTHTNKLKRILCKYNRRLFPSRKKKRNQILCKRSCQYRSDRCNCIKCNHCGINFTLLPEENGCHTQKRSRKKPNKLCYRRKKTRFKTRNRNWRCFKCGTHTTAYRPPPKAPASFWKRCKNAVNTYKSFENKCMNCRPFKYYNKRKGKCSLMRAFFTFCASLCCVPCIVYFCYCFDKI